MSEGSRSKVLLTGASGLLGRAVYAKFKSEGWDVFGVALTRVQEHLHRLDITDKDEVRKAIEAFKPDMVIHAAALRFDKVESNPKAAQALNVDATGHIVEAADEVGVPVLYISTDYVFDGKKDSLYTIHDEPKPINLYGETKLQGERVTLMNPGNLVLRVPVLYGPVLSLKESAITCLLEPLLAKDKAACISHVERRCPAHVDDIALICYQLATSVKEKKSIDGIFQWCGKEKMTKYEMVLKMADVFEIPCEHVSPDTNVVASYTRPVDTEMDRSRLEQMGFGQHTTFSRGIYDVLCSWVSLNVDQLNVRPYTLPTNN